MRSNRQRGGSNLGCFVSLLILAIAIVLVVKIVPNKIAVAQFTDYCKRQVENASAPGVPLNDEGIAKNVVAKAIELKLPVGREAIRVWRGGGEVHLEVKFTVVLDLLVKKHNWNVLIQEDRPIF